MCELGPYAQHNHNLLIGNIENLDTSVLGWTTNHDINVWIVKFSNKRFRYFVSKTNASNWFASQLNSLASVKRSGINRLDNLNRNLVDFQNSRISWKLDNYFHCQPHAPTKHCWKNWNFPISKQLSIWYLASGNFRVEYLISKLVCVSTYLVYFVYMFDLDSNKPHFSGGMIQSPLRNWKLESEQMHKLCILS